METNIFWFMEIGPRDTQEDCIMFDDAIIQVEHGRGQLIIEKDHFIAAVCDGLGGHDAGEVASRFFCDNLLMINPCISEHDILDALKKIQLKSCDMIPSLSGTTLAGVRVKNGRALVFNAGDSRVYHISDKLTLVSHDHSYVQELVDRNMISEKDAEAHPYKNIVTFGMGPVFQSNETGKEIFFSEVELKHGDGILICSDGVPDSLSLNSISEILKDRLKDGENLASLLEENGLRDNTSFVYLWIS